MKVFKGVVDALSTQKTVIVKITRRTPHPVYKKVIKRTKKHKVDSGEFSPKVGDEVKIAETKPISKEKHFKILEIINTKQKGDKNGTA